MPELGLMNCGVASGARPLAFHLGPTLIPESEGW